MAGDPGLREQPEQPEPRKLVDNVIEEVVDRRHTEEDVVRQDIVERTDIRLSQTTEHQQQSNCDRYREIDRECHGEALNLDFARKFAEDVAQIRTQDMCDRGPDDGVAGGENFVFLQIGRDGREVGKLFVQHSFHLGGKTRGGKGGELPKALVDCSI